MSGAHPTLRTIYINGMQSTGIQKIDDSCFIATSGNQPNVAWYYSRIFMNTPISLFSISTVQTYSFTSLMFYGCSNLKNVFIGNNKNTQLGINNSAFYGCTKLETYIVSGNGTGGTYQNAAFMNCYSLSSFYMMCQSYENFAYNNLKNSEKFVCIK